MVEGVDGVSKEEEMEMIQASVSDAVEVEEGATVAAEKVKGAERAVERM